MIHVHEEHYVGVWRAKYVTMTECCVIVGSPPVEEQELKFCGKEEELNFAPLARRRKDKKIPLTGDVTQNDR